MRITTVNSSRNYQRELNAILKENPGGRVLLHSCCAPCSSYCVEYLSAYFDLELLFYNPNISSPDEYARRSVELKKLIGLYEADGTIKKDCVRVRICDHTPEDFERMARGLENEPERGARCRLCYELRLRRAAIEAAEGGFDYFTTTLSISPHKNAVWINEIGDALAAEYGVRHLPSDFKKRNGYLRSIELSKKYGLYRQDYCGCIYSRMNIERIQEKHNENFT